MEREKLTVVTALTMGQTHTMSHIWSMIQKSVKLIIIIIIINIIFLWI